MFGIKVRKVKTSQEYTIEELFDAIKDNKFSAGTPALTKHGFATIITFPPLDRKNQVWIMPIKKKGNSFSIQKNEAAGMGNMAGNMALSTLTGGLSDFSGFAGNKNKAAEKLVDLTADELQEMNL